MEVDFELPEDFMKPLEKTIDLLQRGNIWLLKNKQSFFKKFWRFIYIVPCYLGLFLSMLIFVINLARKGDDYYDLAASVPLIFIVVQAAVKCVVVVHYDEKINGILIQLAAMWPKNEELTDNQLATKLDHLRSTNKFINVYYWINTIAAFEYGAAPIAEMVFRKYVLKQDTPYILPYRFYFPNEATETLPVYLATYAFEAFIIIITVEYLVGVELLIMTVTAHISTIFTLLQDDVFNMKPMMLSKNQISDIANIDISLVVTENRKKTLVDIIRTHQKLIMLTEKIDNIFNLIIFVNLLFGSILICFFGFVAKIARGPGDISKNVVGVVASIVPVFNLCYYGQLLNDASEGLAHSAYVSLWYEGSTQYQKMLCFFILRAQQPCCITNLKVAPVTLRTFTSVMSTTYSYFNLVNSQYEA